MNGDVNGDVDGDVHGAVNRSDDRDHRPFERLVELLLPGTDVPSRELLERARREAQTRWRILRDFDALTGPQIAARHGSSAANRSQTAHRWRKEGRIFGVPFRGTMWYLAFQFDESGQPLDAVASVLHELGGLAPWEIAKWFVRTNPVLDRRRPVDVLRDAPRDVVRAARMTGAHEQGTVLDVAP